MDSKYFRSRQRQSEVSCKTRNLSVWLHNGAVEGLPANTYDYCKKPLGNLELKAHERHSSEIIHNLPLDIGDADGEDEPLRPLSTPY